MYVTEVLSADDVYLDMAVTKKGDVIELLGKLAEGKGAPDAAECRNSLLARERLGSTGLGEGIAIPHAKINNLERPVALFVRLARPIDFGAPDEEPVDLLLMLIMPPDHAPEHLKILSSFARVLRKEGTASRLRGAKTPQEVIEVLVGA